MKTILVVDDEPKILQLVGDYLARAGYGTLKTRDGKSALALVRTEKPDLIILDLGLPEMDGLEVTREIRKHSNAPIIMLTARSEESDKLIGLELGADDYITKPFSPKELIVRVKVLFRRIEAYTDASLDKISAADLTLDMPRMRVTATGRGLEELTPTEFELLAAMARSPGRIFTRSQLLDAIHGVAFESYERAIDAHIKNIRRKIELNPHEPQYILTVYGVGYKFSDSLQQSAERRAGQ
jgi:two-component system, OmpR family, alkaline phosphatase synthesis response regulator PhoP